MRIIVTPVLILLTLLDFTCNNDKAIYTVVCSSSALRTDGASTYFILIKPADPGTASFKKDIEQIINETIFRHGEKISICIFDDNTFLKKSYQEQLHAVKSSENREAARHHIADFRGKTQLGSWIVYFPGFSSANPDPLLEKYFELKIYNLPKL